MATLRLSSRGRFDVRPRVALEAQAGQDRGEVFKCDIELLASLYSVH